MDIILVPGFWLDASSWSEVTPALKAAGHTVHPLTLPGLESVEADRSGIGLQDHIDAVVQAIDGLDRPVVLVGHSGGGGIAYGAVDARPDRVLRTIYVDAGPLGEGAAINDGLPVTGGEVPLPDWDAFDDADLIGLTEPLKEQFRAISRPEPAAVTRDLQQLSNERRRDVPATVIACEFPASVLQQLIEDGHPYVSELARISDVDFVDLPTGHWPQFTRPAELAQLILAAVDASGPA